MNQEQVKENLDNLEDTGVEFTVIFSGKESRKVNGLYHPEKREIIIHNKNFSDDNALMYTAIHEYAHHVHFSGPNPPSSSRAHTRSFRSILHRLLLKAEETGIYANIFDRDERFVRLTGIIRNDFLATNGKLMKDFARLLIEAQELCLETGTSFEDYVDRVLGLQHGSARSIIRINELDIPPEIGYDNMRAIASIRDDEKRVKVQEALLNGMSPDRAFNLTSEEGIKKERPDRLEMLMDEKEKLEKSLERITVRLAKIERELQSLL